MGVNLARVQGRCAVTPHGGAGGGARAWRLVTATPGRPGHQPAGTRTGARGASLEVPHRKVCHEAWPRLSLGMNSPIGREPWWDAERRARSALRAPHPKGAEVGYASVGVPLPCFFPFLHFVARSADRVDTGVHRRCSLAKVGAEGEKFSSRDDDSGANRIARTEEYAR